MPDHDPNAHSAAECPACREDEDHRPTPVERPLRVTQLVGGFAEDNTEAAAGLVRQAKVAWTMFLTDAGGQLVQVNTLLASGVRQRADIVRFLSELYSRAIFETVFAMYFDRADPAVDKAVMALVSEGYSPQMAEDVFRAVAERGVVLCSAPRADHSWRVNPKRSPFAEGPTLAEAAAAARAAREQPEASATAGSGFLFPSLARLFRRQTR